MQSGEGISFSSNANSAGMNSELLDDYEEGTWTPNTPGNFNFTAATGQYVKIGRLVTINGQFTVTSAPNGVYDFFYGIPFTVAYHTTVSFSYIDNLLTLTPTADNAIVLDNEIIFVPALTNGRTVAFSCTYFTDD